MFNFHSVTTSSECPWYCCRIYDRVGVDLGLVGCIHSLRAGSRDEMYTYNLEFANINSDILNGADISKYCLLTYMQQFFSLESWLQHQLNGAMRINSF